MPAAGQAVKAMTAACTQPVVGRVEEYSARFSSLEAEKAEKSIKGNGTHIYP
jgi:hypothetical protein